VLFNALNGLAELIHNDRKEAETAVRHLSDLLRRLLAASEHTSLPLKEERHILSDYLGVEAIRLGERLRVTWDWDERVENLEVLPLLLQPLVENAIKHGVSPTREGGEIIIRARGANSSIYLEVWNSGAPLTGSRKGNGIGVKNLSSRLLYNYGDQASFSLRPQDGGTLASIVISGSQVGWSDETT
jgi:sensor histidine kinase YesM